MAKAVTKIAKYWALRDLGVQPGEAATQAKLVRPLRAAARLEERGRPDIKAPKAKAPKTERVAPPLELDAEPEEILRHLAAHAETDATKVAAARVLMERSDAKNSSQGILRIWVSIGSGPAPEGCLRVQCENTEGSYQTFLDYLDRYLAEKGVSLD